MAKRVRLESALPSDALERVTAVVEGAAAAQLASGHCEDPAVAWSSALGTVLYALCAKTWAQGGLTGFRALRGRALEPHAVAQCLAPLGIDPVDAGDAIPWDALPELELSGVAELYGALVGAAHGWQDSARAGTRSTADRYGFARKRRGVYFTPPALVDALMDAVEAHGGQPPETLLDPACGAGALLLRAQARRARARPELGVAGLFGVDVDPLAVHLCRLRLWDRVGCDPVQGQLLGQHILLGNALIGVPPPGVAAQPMEPPAGVVPLNWPTAFESVWARGGFDWVLSNPPWERIKFQARDYLRDVAPALAVLAHRADRERALQGERALRAALALRRDQASEFSSYLRGCGAFPLSAHGDLNAYPLFVERCLQLLVASGPAVQADGQPAIRGRDTHVGLIVPSGLATDFGHRHLFSALHESGHLRALYDFENRAGFFPSVDSRFRFSLVVLGPPSPAPTQVATLLSEPEERHGEGRTWPASVEMLRALNPESGGLAMFRSAASAEVGLAMHARVAAEGGADWGLSFHRMFDMTNHADLFIGATAGEPARRDERFGWSRADVVGAEEVTATLFQRELFGQDEASAVPLYEGKLFWQHDGAFGTFEGCSAAALRKGRAETRSGALVARSARGRFWVQARELEKRLPPDGAGAEAWIAIRALTNPTNQRTLVAALIPPTAVGNSALVVRSSRLGREPREVLELSALLVAHFNALVLDDLARQKMGNTNVNMYLLRQLPLLPLEAFERPLFGSGPSARALIARRALGLAMVCEPVGAAVARHFPEVRGLFGEEERAQALAELDALFALLYGLSAGELEACLEPPAPLKSFGVLRQQECARFGHFETKRRVLEAYLSAPSWSQR